MYRALVTILKNSHSIKSKLIYRMLSIFSLLFFVILVLVLFNFRRLGVNSAKKEAESIATLTKDALTSFMVMNTIQHRSVFFNQMKSSSAHLNSIRVLRGDSVIAQHGPPMADERPTSALEFLVLRSGKKQERFTESMGTVFYELAVPYIATKEGHLNCLSCHHAKEGDVLGAVSIKIDISQYRKAGIITLLIGGAISFVFFILTIYMVFHFFTPYTNFFEQLKKIFEKIQEGHLEEKVNFFKDDEAGDVADGLNFMTDRLSLTLGNIRSKISLLIGHQMKSTGNALKDTSLIVEELVKIYNFKRTIENDPDKFEIYKRVGQMLSSLDICHYSIYEINNDRNSMLHVISGGPKTQAKSASLLENNSTMLKANTSAATSLLLQKDQVYCKNIIFSQADECRAKRTGQIVDSNEFPFICPNFLYNPQNPQKYFCIPVYLNKGVHNIIQLIYHEEQSNEIRQIVPFIKIYLQEAAPILEARLYMEMLEQRSIVDQLTGLYNRRFLEELSEQLRAQTIRRNSLMGILMADVDFFKRVNDSFGHDAGDKVLKNIAMQLKKNVREADIVIRFGGEEFLILLMDVDSKEAAVSIAEKLRKSVSDSIVEVGNKKIQTNISIGVSLFPKNSPKFWQCVKLADISLYKAKNSGRNRVVAFEPSFLQRKKNTN